MVIVKFTIPLKVASPMYVFPIEFVIAGTRF